jgi:ribosomal protein S18 acetylase RimI-like enzyme
VIVRPYLEGDVEALWAILEPVIRAGESYALPRDWPRAAALGFWTRPEHAVFVAEEDGRVVGSYFLRANALGGGGHVANAGYVTDPGWNGRGVGAALCLHSLDEAVRRGFRAMQFNFVVATNARAIALWERFGFAVAGRLPGAFVHPSSGPVDALVMYRSLPASP